MNAVVVDASVLIAALMSDGRARRVLVHAPCAFYVPPHILDQAYRHLGAIAKRARLPKHSVKSVMDELFDRIEVVPAALFSPFLEDAKKRTRSADAEGDEHYVALADALDAPIWTYDNDFDRIPGIRRITTSDVAQDTV